MAPAAIEPLTRYPDDCRDFLRLALANQWRCVRIAIGVGRYRCCSALLVIATGRLSVVSRGVGQRKQIYTPVDKVAKLYFFLNAHIAMLSHITISLSSSSSSLWRKCTSLCSHDSRLPSVNTVVLLVLPHPFCSSTINVSFSSPSSVAKAPRVLFCAATLCCV